MYFNRGHEPPQSVNIWRVDFRPDCLPDKMQKLQGACVGFPNPTFWQRNLSSLKWVQIAQSAGIRWFHRRW